MRKQPKYRVEYRVSEMLSEGHGGFYELAVGVARNRREQAEWVASGREIFFRRHKVVTLPAIKPRYPR